MISRRKMIGLLGMSGAGAAAGLVGSAAQTAQTQNGRQYAPGSLNYAQMDGMANPRRPGRKNLLAWAPMRNGFQHDSVSHALSTIEHLGYVSQLYDTYIHTDSQPITKHGLFGSDGQVVYGPDLNDFDAAETPMLIDTIYKGEPRKLLVEANRNGFIYVLDRTNGKFLSATRFAEKLTWATGIDAQGRPIRSGLQPTAEGTKMCPGFAGATNWFAPSYNESTRLVYFLATEECETFFRKPQEPDPRLPEISVYDALAEMQKYRRILKRFRER